MSKNAIGLIVYKNIQLRFRQYSIGSLYRERTGVHYQMKRNDKKNKKRENVPKRKLSSSKVGS